jgi:hypothetical protein
MNIRYLLFGLSFFLLASSVSFGQGTEVGSLEDSPISIAKNKSAFYLGPVFGFNKAMHSANLSTFAEDVLCPIFSDGSASGYHFGAFYEQFIGGITSQHSFVARVLYNTFPAKFTQVGDNPTSRLQDHSGNYVTIASSTNNTNEVKYNCLSLDLMYKFRALLIPNLGALAVTVGPTIDYVLTKTNTQKVELVSPDNVQFIPLNAAELAKNGWKYSDDLRTITVYDGDIESAKSMRFGIKAGLQLELKLPGTPIDIIPGAFYNLALTDVSNQDWKVNAFQLSVDVRFAISYLVK